MGGCSPWMILSHMAQQQIVSTATFYQGFHGGVLTLNDIVSYGSAANNKYCHFLSGGSMGGCSPWMILSHMVQQQTINTATFYQGVPWGGAHLEWYLYNIGWHWGLYENIMHASWWYSPSRYGEVNIIMTSAVYSHTIRNKAVQYYYYYIIWSWL